MASGRATPACCDSSATCVAPPVPEARVVITTAPGEECQVDYGDGPMVRDRATGKYRRTRLFVLTLGYSRKSVRLIVPKSSSRIWAELHERAFRQLGGAPRIVVLDSQPTRGRPVTGRVRPDAKSALSRGACALRRRALPCRVRDPDRSRVSGTHSERRCVVCASDPSEEAQVYLDRWETNWADTRIHGTTSGGSRGHVCRGARAPAAAVSPSATTSTASAPCPSTAAWSKPPTTAHRQAGSVGGSACNGMAHGCVCSTRLPGCCSARAPAPRARSSPHPPRRRAVAHAVDDGAASAPRSPCRPPHRRLVRPRPPRRRRDRRKANPGRAGTGPQARCADSGRRGEDRHRARRAQLPISAPLPRTPARRAAEPVRSTR